jgi:hypothetical protein
MIMIISGLLVDVEDLYPLRIQTLIVDHISMFYQRTKARLELACPFAPKICRR